MQAANTVKTASRFWIRWEEAGSDPRPRRHRTAPLWWHTGATGMGDATICAVVDANDAADAEAIIRRHWTPLEISFCMEVLAGWMPPTDRFPPPRRAA